MQFDFFSSSHFLPMHTENTYILHILMIKLTFIFVHFRKGQKMRTTDVNEWDDEERGCGRGGQEFAPTLSWASTIRDHLLPSWLPNCKSFWQTILYLYPLWHIIWVEKKNGLSLLDNRPSPIVLYFYIARLFWAWTKGALLREELEKILRKLIN